MDTPKVLTFPRIMYKLADAKTDRRKNLVKWRGVDYESLTCANAEAVKPGFKTLEEWTKAQPVEVVEEKPRLDINGSRRIGRPRK